MKHLWIAIGLLVALGTGPRDATIACSKCDENNPGSVCYDECAVSPDKCPT